MRKAPEKWDLETDVLVAGSGAAAMSAAITAADHGAAVVLIEKSAFFGGTSAMSGGGMWIPNNHLNIERGIEDPEEEVFGYCKLLAAGYASDELIKAYLDAAPQMLKYIAGKTGMKLQVTPMPDYHPELPGGRDGKHSRTVMPDLFCVHELGENAQYLRPAPSMIPIRPNELWDWNAIPEPQNIDFTLIAQRMGEGWVSTGSALMGCLYKGCLDLKVDMHLNTPFVDLVMDNGRVIGACAQKGGKDFFIKARKGVILGTGGYEWNEELKKAFLAGPITHPNSVPSNEGDALKACMSIGAALGNMSENWGWVSAIVPGEEYEGKQLSRGILSERTVPHQIIVNKRGKRFVNEAADYNSMFKSLWEIDANTMEQRNLPCFSIFDQQFKDKYCFATIMPGDPAPPWVLKAETVGELAKLAGINPEGLEATVAQWNGYVEKGQDPDFNRGASVYDALWGDPGNKPNATMGTIDKAPFYAIRLHPGSLGTNGGPKTNANAEVLHIDGNVIGGLYVVGNTMASVTGPSYWGGGATIGPCMTFGYLAGRHAASKQ